MKIVKISAAAALACALAVSANAEDAKPKRTLKNNMQEVYNVVPSSVDNLSAAFSEGMVYGRLRANTFYWDWQTPNSWNSATGKGNLDNRIMGLGGSIIYKTAPLYGLSATAGVYGSVAPFWFREDIADIGGVKAGKDTISRYDVKDGGKYHMIVLAQMYGQYDFSKNSVKFGRQIFESVLTKSNDTKMVPNTFEGIALQTKEIPATTIRGAYFYAQKLRDHTTFHDVITFKDAMGQSWNNNDDAAVHKGLSYANFKAKNKDTDHALIVADVVNKSVPNLTVNVTYTAVPEVVSSVIGELNYKIPLVDKYSLTPGVRYMKQMDNGGGEVGGASLDGTVNATTLKGYTVGDSLDSSLVMGRLVLTDGILKVQAGYSAVADEADILAPWRGFPTGGYTRAMAQYNWRANTKTTAFDLYYDFGKAKMVDGLGVLVRYAMQDFDETKVTAGMEADSSIWHIDVRKQFTKEFDAKIRIGLKDAENRAGATTNADSYNEYRFELNYLF